MPGPGLIAIVEAMRRSVLTVAILSLLAAACAGADPAATTASSSRSSTASPDVSSSANKLEIVLLEGSIEVPAATAFGDPGFHEPFVLTGTVPEAAAGASGELIITLRDVGRPDQTCDRDHPLSGCVTVDWSDFEGRPGVPDGGVFDNRLSLVSSSGGVELFLSERDGLAAVPDEYTPT